MQVKGEIGLVSQAEVHAFYSNLTHSQRTKSIGDTTLNQLMSSKEIALGKEVYAQIVMLHAKIRQEPISKAILAFRKKFGDELSSKFHLFEQKYCDPDFFLKEGGEKI